MAKEKSEEKEATPLELSKLLIKELNQKDKEKIAWCLGGDDDDPTTVREFISTGSTLLDYIIANRRNGGIPVGKLTEIMGDEASGKSLVCGQILAETQRRGGLAVYIDTENSANPDFLQTLGVNIRELVYLQPATCEEVGEVIVKIILMARAKSPNRLITIVWDGIAATPTKMMASGNFDVNMNVQLEKSKVLAIMMDKLSETLGKERVCLVFTNQLKTKIGVMYGDPMGTPGGKAVPYAASVRIRLSKAGELRVGRDGVTADDAEGVDKGDAIGIHTRAKIIKNRMGPPLRVCEFDIVFSSGIHDVDSWRDYLHLKGEIEKGDGFMYLSSFPSGKLGVKGVWEGKDRGVSFREGNWSELVRLNPKLKEHVLNLLEKHAVVKYGVVPKDMSIDAESLLDNEAVVEKVKEMVA
jgi:recombination protein RecA